MIHVSRPPADVLFVNWRDLGHPEGGGSERYVHRVAEGLAAAGLRVEMFCAAHDRAPADEVVGGVRVVRRGNRLGVYPRALLHVLRSRARLVVDVQNGLPFCSPLVTRAPVTVLVHHVHREQWPIVFGRVGGAVGWWLESRFAPWVYRRSRYVTVSHATRTELAGLGVDPSRVAVVPNGIEPAPRVAVRRSATPRVVVLGRLVPHKQVEHALEVVARLQERWPDLTLSIVGEGWWEERLRAEADRLGITDRVEFSGFLDEPAKHAELAAAWLQLCPSVKEGWGLVVTEAGAHRTPTVGYRSAGGLTESVLDGRTGVLVDDLEELTDAVDRLLGDGVTRTAMGVAAARHAAAFDWPSSVRGWARELLGVLAGMPASARADAGPGSAAGAVVEDVERLLVALLDRGRVGVDDGRDAGDGSGADTGTGAEGQEHDQEGLHAGTRFLEERRRSATVDAASVIHNAAPTTAPAAAP
ncbi:glycosyltransferase family 4 protein [Geodermatophilus amargosae]|uniref:glycosyltransferase family 4 protein n=1 Tax=Geodermatophilus amargosae TaxID=1296565 RepID=UPI0034DEA0C7